MRFASLFLILSLLSAPLLASTDEAAEKQFLEFSEKNQYPGPIMLRDQFRESQLKWNKEIVTPALTSPNLKIKIEATYLLSTWVHGDEEFTEKLIGPEQLRAFTGLPVEHRIWYTVAHFFGGYGGMHSGQLLPLIFKDGREAAVLELFPFLVDARNRGAAEVQMPADKALMNILRAFNGKPEYAQMKKQYDDLSRWEPRDNEAWAERMARKMECELLMSESEEPTSGPQSER